MRTESVSEMLENLHTLRGCLIEKIFYYICSPTKYTKFFNEWVYSSRMLGRHVSDLTGPSSRAFYKLYLQIWYVVLLDTSSRYFVQAVTLYKLYLQIWYVVIRVLLFQKLYNGWTCRVVRVLPHTRVCEYSLYKTLLMMDRWGPKHVELT